MHVQNKHKSKTNITNKIKTQPSTSYVWYTVSFSQGHCSLSLPDIDQNPQGAFVLSHTPPEALDCRGGPM